MLSVLLVVHVLTPVDVRTIDLTFVRHGETVANATGVYNSKTLNVLSDLGNEQVRKLTPKLLAMPRFDLILVSPSPRVLRTIHPYLVATRQRATVFPLLYECCTQRRPANAHATSFKWGTKVVIPEEMKDQFVINPNWDRLPVSPDYNAGLAQVAASVKEFRTIALGKRALVVGHSGHGGQFWRTLTGQVKQIKNATPLQATIKP